MRTSMSAPVRWRLRSASPVQRARPVSDNVNPPALRASGCGAISTHAVSLPSMMRCTRSHVVNGIRVSAAGGTSARSSTTHAEAAGLEHEVERFQRAIDQTVWSGSPTPLFELRRAKETATRAPRSRRSRSIPAAAADATSRRSNVSTNAAISPRRVDAAIACSTSVVRPDECGPTISESWPRGTPPRGRHRARQHRWRSAPMHRVAPAVAAPSSSVRSSFRARSAVSSQRALIRHMFASTAKI